MISNQTITQTVTLGSVNSYPTYASPLTITSTGTVVAGAGDGIYGGVALVGTIDNAVRVSGGIGNAGSVGGAEIDPAGRGNIVNSGTIAGGAVGVGGTSLRAGNAGGYSAGGGGGAGIDLATSGSVVNSGPIAGGASGAIIGPEHSKVRSSSIP
jgi:hypothetical protein